LLILLATAKIFSPQYLLWIWPLFALVYADRWPWIGGGLAALGLTLVIFPLWYFESIVRIGPGHVLGPTTLGILLLALRNGLCVAGAIFTYRTLYQDKPELQPPRRLLAESVGT